MIHQLSPHSLAPSRTTAWARAALPLEPPFARAGGWQVISHGAFDHLPELVTWLYGGLTVRGGKYADCMDEKPIEPSVDHPRLCKFCCDVVMFCSCFMDYFDRLPERPAEPEDGQSAKE